MLERTLGWDLAATRALRCLPHQTYGDALLSGASRVTDEAAGWIVAGITAAIIDRPRRHAWLLATATVVAADRGSVLIKRIARRRRPQLDGLPALASAPSPLSFPSSHTASAVAAAISTQAVLDTNALMPVAALIAFSRPYLGMHYPSDVAAGAAVGAIAGRLGRRAIERFA